MRKITEVLRLKGNRKGDVGSYGALLLGAERGTLVPTVLYALIHHNAL